MLFKCNELCIKYINFYTDHFEVHTHIPKGHGFGTGAQDKILGRLKMELSAQAGFCRPRSLLDYMCQEL